VYQRPHGTDDPAFLDRWRERWSDLVEFDIFPVIRSDQAAARVGVAWERDPREWGLVFGELDHGACQRERQHLAEPLGIALVDQHPARAPSPPIGVLAFGAQGAAVLTTGWPFQVYAHGSSPRVDLRVARVE
jgi:hypothetical protein